MKIIKTNKIEIKNKFRNINRRYSDGIKGELFVLGKMLKNKIPFSSLDRRRDYDILARNKRIEVKSARRLISRENEVVYQFNFSTKISRRKNTIGFDYAICVCLDKRDQSYIIPASFFSNDKLSKHALKRSILIKPSNKNDPVYKFRNAWRSLRKSVFCKTEKHRFN